MLPYSPVQVDRDAGIESPRGTRHDVHPRLRCPHRSRIPAAVNAASTVLVIKIMRSLACLALLLATPLAAQSNAERMLNDRYSRSHDYDLVHQRIELRGFDWDSASFDGVVTTTLRSLRAGLDSVVLDAGELLDFSAVETVNRSGQATGKLRHSRLRDTLVVYLPRPAGFGDTLRFRLAYHGRVEDGRGLTFIEADSEPPRRPRQLWSQGEDENNHFWFPTYDFPNDKMTWEVWATVPRGFTAVSNGKLMLDRPNPGWDSDLSLEPGATIGHLSGLPHRGAAGEDPRHVARHSGGLLRLPAGQRSGATPVSADARHDRDLLEADRRSLPVEQVRPDHRRRFLRRHGKRERHDSGGLAAGSHGLRRPALVLVRADRPRARASMVRRLRHDRELGQHVAQ